MIKKRLKGVFILAILFSIILILPSINSDGTCSVYPSGNGCAFDGSAENYGRCSSHYTSDCWEETIDFDDCSCTCTSITYATPCTVYCDDTGDCQAGEESYSDYPTAILTGSCLPIGDGTVRNCCSGLGDCEGGMCAGLPGYVSETCDELLECQTSIGCNGNFRCHHYDTQLSFFNINIDLTKDYEFLAEYIPGGGENWTWLYQEEYLSMSETDFGAGACYDSYDNDCDGDIDGYDSDCPDYSGTCIDNDGDRYSLEANPDDCGDNCGGQSCLGGGDCDDNDITIWSRLAGYQDYDSDTFYNETPEYFCTDGNLPIGYRLTPGTDCNDYDALVNPGMPEIGYCNDGEDNDCDEDLDCLDEECKSDEECISCTFTNAYWNESKIGPGNFVEMVLEGTDCDSMDNIVFTIMESDGSAVNDDLIQIEYGFYDKLIWISTWTYTQNEIRQGQPEADDDDIGNGDREYYFWAFLQADPLMNITSSLLNVSRPLGDCITEGGVEICHPETETSVCTGNTIQSTTNPGECCDQACCILQSTNDACTTQYGSNYECGSAPQGCGWTANCGNCGTGTCLSDGTCCYPDCEGKVCGDDGCGGTCAPGCGANEECVAGNCYSTNVCTIVNASWDRSYAWKYDDAYLEVYATSKCDGELAEFQIWHNDPRLWIEGDLNWLDPDDETFLNGYVKGTWTTEYYPGGSGDLPEYLFKVFTSYEETDTLQHDGFKLLSVNTTECPGILTCGDYKTEQACSENACRRIVIGTHEDQEGITCGDTCETEPTWISCGCTWNENLDKCEFAYTEYLCDEVTDCTDNILEPGEACSGTNLAGMTCLDFGFSGGTLSCNNCNFDVSSCTGYSCNNDGIVDFGSEVCDGFGTNANFSKPLNLPGSEWKCSDFDDFDSGFLECDNCILNTTWCRRSNENQETELGSCRKSQDAIKGCDEEPNVGLYITSWSGVWIPGHTGFSTDEACENYYDPGCEQSSIDNLWYYDPQGRMTTCTEGGETVIDCPAKVPLPFFNPYNLVTAILLIGAIYIIIIIRKT